MTLNEVFPHVQQDVVERVADLPGGAEEPSVISPGDDLSTSPEHPIHCPGETCRDRHHAACQSVLRLRLHDQMEMILLNGVFDQAEVPTLTSLAKGSSQFQYE